MAPKFVTVSETIPLPRNTVEGLIETWQEVFSSKESKPFRVVYSKNEPLVVDRRVRSEMAGQGIQVSAYEMVRQHSDIEIVDEVSNPIRCLAKAAQAMSNRDAKLVCLVTNNKFEAYAWFDEEIRPEKMLNTVLIEDPDCPDNCLFVCASKSGSSIKDIEYATLCRMD